jgi:two-component system chemotaxis sensor kinase CheA
MDDLIIEFITETNESLAEIDMDLLNLEQNPNDQALLGNIFRLMHTIKGTCGFLGLPRLEKVAHHAENVLGRFRDGDLEVKPEYVTLIFESIDRIKFIVGEIENSGAEPEGDDSALINHLDAVYEGKDSAPTSPELTPEQEVEEMVALNENKTSVAIEGHISAEELAALEEAFNNAEFDPDFYNEDKQEVEAEAVAEKKEDKPAPAPAPIAAQQEEDNAPAAQNAAPKTVQSLRVNVDVLENLMTMVSELVLTRNQLLQIQRHTTDGAFDSPLQNLNHVVSELQEGVMKTRMQPVGNAWSKLPRIIRDLCIDLGKKIDLVMTGQDTELDRQVLDLIKDPLTHMVRNSADHGVEMPEERKAAGKKETGTINLNAYHEGGHIIIEIIDDGKGLNTARIKQKAIDNGLATAEELEAMSANQIHQFVFHAGFSTAEKVTSVSGRGVGMDVVRTNIEKIGGTIDLKSTEGKGSTFSIKIPLTLAIVSALIVESAGERFAIPQLSVQELVMASDTGENRIEQIKGTPVFRLRDHLLPLIHLDELLQIKKPEVVEEQKLDEDGNVVSFSKHKKSRNKHIVVTKVGAYLFGIIVDQVHDTEEIVVKPVASILKNIEIFSGNTILGDGTVIMILDPAGIARATGEISVSDTHAAKDELEAQKRHNESTSLLLFSTGKGAPKAVPLSLVSRLEDIDTSKIEPSDGKLLIQYRGELIPLIKFEESLELKTEEMQPTLIFTDGRRTMGLMVDNIVDIIEERINIQINATSENYLGSAIIKEKATDIIDVGFYLNRAFPEWFKNHGDEAYDEQDSEHIRRVLLVDDSPFFRNMLTPLLSVAGYDVTTAESPIEALKLYDKGNTFDIIISDIEMPEMSGFEFAEKVRAEGMWEGTPLVALSSHATPKDIERGRAVGFSDYVAKFDRDTLLNTLSETLSHQGERA